MRATHKGFPTAEMVGLDGVNAAWLLTVHAAGARASGRSAQRSSSPAYGRSTGRPMYGSPKPQHARFTTGLLLLHTMARNLE